MFPLALAVSLMAVTALAKVPLNPWTAPPADDGMFFHLSGCSLSDTAFAPPRTIASVSYSIIGSESVQVSIFLDIVSPPEILELQRSIYRLQGRRYTFPFDGVVEGMDEDRHLDDGFFAIRVRAFSDSGRIEECRLPIEIDRRPPRILRYDVNGDTARAVTVRNGDTILIDAYMDRPSYRVVADFSRVDNDTASLFTSVLDHGDGRYTIRRFLSEASTVPDGRDLPVTLTYTDLAGNVLKDSSLKVCLSNRPPRLVSSRVLNEAGPVVRKDSIVNIETIWESSDTLLTLTADFSGIDSEWSVGNLLISRFAGNRYNIRYTISSDNTIVDGPGYLVTFQATDHGCGISDLETITLELDNDAGDRPILDALPISTRSSTVAVEGSATGSYRVEILRNNVVVDTVLTSEAGRFAGVATLTSGVNTITVKGIDPAGNATPASLPGSILYLTEAFRRFRDDSAPAP